jgi:carboxymethylenebutenolidase
VSKEDLTLERAEGGPLRAYAAQPEGAPDAPGVVVIHEVWGVETHIRSVVDRLAAAGYRAIAPDLIGMDVTIPHEVFLQCYMAIRQLPPEERAVPEKVAAVIERVPAEHRDQVRALVAHALRGQTPEGLAGIDSAVKWLRGHGAKKVAVTGFCMGGAYTWAYAYAGGDAEAYVPFYGRVPEHQAPEKVRGALLGHYGGADHGIPVGPIEAAAESLRRAGHEATIHVYEDAPHAFFNDVRDTYRADAAKLAWDRTLAFFDKKLR